MRVNRWHEWAQRTLARAGSATIAAVEAGVDDVPFGTRILLTNGGQLHIQWVRTAPPSGDASTEEENVVTGQAPAPVEGPAVAAAGKASTTDLERHLAALLNNGGNDELVRVDAYADDPRLGSANQPHGVRVLCHSGAVIYGLFRHTLSAGQQPSKEAAFRQREAV